MGRLVRVQTQGVLDQRRRDTFEIEMAKLRLLEVFLSSLLLSIILGGGAGVSGEKSKFEDGKEIGQKLEREINPGDDEDVLRQDDEGENGDEDEDDEEEEDGEEEDDIEEEEEEEDE